MTKYLSLLLLVLLAMGCKNPDKKGRETSQPKVVEKHALIDTVYHYGAPDHERYLFDTLVNNVKFSIQTFCLNDSSLVSLPYKSMDDGRTELAYFVAHNYESIVKVLFAGKENTFRISKESFGDSLSTEFLDIAHLWYNRFSRVEDGKLLLEARVAKPDTDYQYELIYSIDPEGKIRIEEKYSADDQHGEE